MMKRHMVPLSKKGQTVKHQGKGSQMTGMPDRKQIQQLSAPGSTMNNYAKATPMPPSVGPTPGAGGYGGGYGM